MNHLTRSTEALDGDEVTDRSGLSGRHLIILAGYALLTVVMTWPAVPWMATHLPGQGQDLWEHWWNFWWLKKSLLQGQTPFHTDLLFHPQGVSLVYHNFAWAQFFSWLPLQAVAGSSAAFAVVILMMFALSGYTMYLLARDVTGSGWAGFVAGVVYAFWPYAQSHFNHPNFRAIPWFPSTLFYLRRLLREGRRRDVIGLTLSVALVGLTRWQLLTMEAIIVGLYLVHHWVTRPEDLRWQRLAQVVMAGGAAFLLLLPLMSPILLDMVSGGVPSEVMIDEQVEGQTDFLAYVLPSRYHPLWGDAVWPWYQDLAVNRFYVAFVGYVSLGLALYGLVRARQRSLFWGLLALVVVFLALGPVLRVNGKLFGSLPMPYRLIGGSIFVRALRKPDRFNILLGMPIAMMAAWGVETLRSRLSPPAAKGMSITLAGLILFEYWMVPFPTVRLDVPTWYGQLKQASGRVAILDLPIDSFTYDKEYMGYQVAHGKPIVGGHVSRLTPDALQFIKGQPFLRQLYEDDTMDPELRDVSRQLAYLAEHDVRYVVLHKDNLAPEKLARWKDWLTLEPVHDSQAVAVYRTKPLYERDFHFDYRMSPSIGLIRCTTSPTGTRQAGTISVDARWGTSRSVDRDLALRLSLRDDGGETVQSEQVPLSRDWPTGEWPANAVVRAEYALQIDPYVPPGELDLYLTLIDEGDGRPVGEAVRVETLSVNGLPRSFDVPPVDNPADAVFGDALVLLGYDDAVDDDAARITLHWKALRRMDVAYKFFVHVVDADTGEVLAQADVMPHDWTYPTAWWERGEVVGDDVTVPIGHLPAGAYRLTVGVYDPDTGERLPISRATGLTSDDGRLWLPELLER